MSFKKFLITITACISLISCSTFNPKYHPTGYQSINDVSIKDKNSSKIYILHQPYEFPGLPIRATIYADDKLIGRTFPDLILIHETNKPKVRLDVYGQYCSMDNFTDYGSGKINLDLKPAEDVYVIVREKRNAFEIPVGGNLITAALLYSFCTNVENDKSAFHEFRKVSKEAWTEISKTKSSGADAWAGSYKYKDEELKAAREYLLKEQK
jgi:hypothetical protein